VQGKTTKKLLRFLARKHLPGEPYRQPKRGFEVPLKKWVNQDLRGIIDDYLNSKQAFFLQFLDVKFVHDLMKKRVRVSEEKRAKMLWSLFALEVWHKNFAASKPDVKNMRYAA
jgi:asparagine synthase (glutamine-hydrolysing)